jgi:hypothetical protein
VGKRRNTYQEAILEGSAVVIVLVCIIVPVWSASRKNGNAGDYNDQERKDLDHRCHILKPREPDIGKQENGCDKDEEDRD